MKKNLQKSSILLTQFKSISNFINDLNRQFGSNQRSLQLYNRLIEKTTIVHEKPIKKHIEAFRQFLTKNKTAIFDKKINEVKGVIHYSNNVFINIPPLLGKATPSDKRVIWEHLMTIYATVFPNSKAKELLKKSLASSCGENKNEKNFLQSVFNNIGSQVDPNANPMESMGSIMQSGLFQNLVGDMSKGIESGGLDLGKLMGTVTGMISSLGNLTSTPELKSLQPLVNNMTQTMNTLNKNEFVKNKIKSTPQSNPNPQPTNTQCKRLSPIKESKSKQS